MDRIPNWGVPIPWYPKFGPFDTKIPGIPFWKGNWPNQRWPKQWWPLYFGPDNI